MRLSNMLGERFKEDPSEAFMPSHKFLLRGGYIRQVSKGIFSLLTPGIMVAQNIENIIREEMNSIDGQEVKFPVVLPASLWKESGRFESVDKSLVRFEDRNGQNMVLGMTHEEAAVHLARSEAQTYTKFPFMIYQIQTKFRDEPRARGGLVRVREFTMKDAYSFHISNEDMSKYYYRVHESYERIYKKLGIKNVISIEADSGMMGGNISHEFMYISQYGEDSIVICDNCDYKSNMEVAVSKVNNHSYIAQDIIEINTPNIKSIDELSKFLNIEYEQTLKAAVFIRKDDGKLVLAFIRGDKEVNESKLTKILHTDITPYSDDGDSGLSIGFIGPYKIDMSDIDIIYDYSLKNTNNLVCGANKTDYHYKGLNISRDLNIDKYYDIAKVKDGEKCINCSDNLKVIQGIEVGNIFQLGDKYTKSMNMHYTDKDGKLQTPIMCSYGIGIGRAIACIIEENNDNYGPIWPVSIAPWKVEICLLNTNIDKIIQTGEKLYNKVSKSFDTIIDDRDLSAGIKFADADLIGCPIRIIISKRNIANNQVEISSRDKSIKEIIDINTLLENYNKIIDNLLIKTR